MLLRLEHREWEEAQAWERKGVWRGQQPWARASPCHFLNTCWEQGCGGEGGLDLCPCGAHTLVEEISYKQADR